MKAERGETITYINSEMNKIERARITKFIMNEAHWTWKLHYHLHLIVQEYQLGTMQTTETGAHQHMLILNCSASLEK